MEGFEKQIHFPQREEILNIILKYAKDAVILRELNDENGPCVLELSAKDSEGNKVIYSYMRKGKWPDAGSTTVTSINLLRIPESVSIGGKTIAEYDDNTGEWTYFADDDQTSKRWMPE